jgi:tRNA 5-methylaminomethyl-2-thiouridine biosynthesis bifunctional protein
VNTRHVVLDTDFGRGERFMAMWARHHGGLHYLAVTPRLPAAEEVADTRLRALWPLDVPGFHRLLLDDGRVTLDLLVGALESVLPQIDARVDQFFIAASISASTSALTPETSALSMSPASLARGLAKLAGQGAMLHADAPDEALVWALTSAGFACQAIDGTPDVAAIYQSRKPQPAPSPEPIRRAIVIGAGLAGSAAAHRLCANGWQVTLIERHERPAQEASGNLAGIFMPLLSKDDNIPTRLSRAAYLFALREWRRLGGVGSAFDGAVCGVLQLARDADHARVQQEVVAQWNYPPEYARWLDADAAGALLGGATPLGGWLFEQGGWARPASLCEAMLNACGASLQRVFHAEALTLQRVGDEWQVRGGDGAPIAQAPTVILANGTSAINIAQAAELPLTALRGQVTHLSVQTPVSGLTFVHEQSSGGAEKPVSGLTFGHEHDCTGVPRLSLVVCREAYVTPAAKGIVSAGATYDSDLDPSLRASSQLENLTRLAEIVPGEGVAALASTAPLAGRVGFRCAAPDRLPLAGALPDYPSAGRLERLRDVPRHPGLHGLLGYASRGLIWAPLMAELLVAQLENAPPPLEAALVEALDPGRFLLKQRRRSQ